MRKLNEVTGWECADSEKVTGKNPRDTATLGSQAEDDKLANELETSSQWVRKDVSYGR